MEPAQEIRLQRTGFSPSDRVEERKSLVDEAYKLDLLLHALIESFRKFDPRGTDT